MVTGTKPVLQKTVEAIFNDRSKTIYPGACKVLNSTARQIKICRKDPGLQIVLANARSQAIDACEQNFQYDRWNCSLFYNRKAKKSIFKKIYRETAFVHALVAASLTHAVAKGCASGDLYRCSCLRRRNNTTHWKGAGCGDDFKYGKRLIRNFLGLKETGNDQIANILKQDVLIGVNSIKQHLKEVCKCHGFSGSCTTKTCWRRLGPFNSAMGLLKKHYHHAIRKKIVNVTIGQPVTKNMLDFDKLVYLQRTPNLCVSTKGRVCKDRNNCATLCCGRGFTISKKSIKTKCRCKMAKCCLVTCDTCVEDIDVFTCK
ncbi:protein Wnt-4 [Papilio machaon]|uniref:protein Wnt-4 n=1 Tax=Papilio machaon TaxID=76193 RepID=UPI001E6658EC|nr:protein Wnt-4 [Papilio machaon]